MLQVANRRWKAIPPHSDYQSPSSIAVEWPKSSTKRTLVFCFLLFLLFFFQWKLYFPRRASIRYSHTGCSFFQVFSTGKKKCLSKKSFSFQNYKQKLRAIEFTIIGLWSKVNHKRRNLYSLSAGGCHIIRNAIAPNVRGTNCHRISRKMSMSKSFSKYIHWVKMLKKEKKNLCTKGVWHHCNWRTGTRAYFGHSRAPKWPISWFWFERSTGHPPANGSLPGS